MTEFEKNTVIAVVAALLAFIFAFVLELLKRWVDARRQRFVTRNLALLTLRNTQKILESISTRYDDNDFFDYVYLDQLTEITKQLDNLRFKERFFKRTSDQTDYFNLVSRLYLLASNMRSLQNFKYAKYEVEGKEKLIDKRQNAFISELKEISTKIDSLLAALDD